MSDSTFIVRDGELELVIQKTEHTVVGIYRVKGRTLYADTNFDEDHAPKWTKWMFTRSQEEQCKWLAMIGQVSSAINKSGE